MTTIRPSRILALLVVTVGCLLVSQHASAQSAGAFIQRGFGTRGISMGNAQVADIFGEGSPWYNPSLAPFYRDQSLEASYTFLSMDRTLEYLQFNVPMPPQAGISAGLIHAGVSNIDGRDGSGYHTEYYSTDEIVGFLAFGSRVGERAAIGISFRFYRADLLPDLDPATSIGLAIGGTYTISPDWALGVSLNDLISRYEWDSSDVFGSSGRKTTNDFPVTLRVGSSYRLLEGDLIVSAEYESRFESIRAFSRSAEIVGGRPLVLVNEEERTLYSGRLRAGGEYRIADIFLLRLGFDRVADGSVSEVIPSAGFSVEQQLGELGAGIQYTFGKEPFSLGTFHVIGVKLNI